MPVVSVVIPTYNRSHALSKALLSVLGQTYQDFEIIVVDDASHDDTELTIKQFQKNEGRIQYIKHNQNKGAAEARNTGINLARGEYIAFLDSDDEWKKEKLERQLEFMQGSTDYQVDREIDQKSKGSLLSCTGFILHLLDDNKTIVQSLTRHKNINESILNGCDLSPGSTMMVQKGVFDRVGTFDSQLKRLEDWDWLLRYREFGKIGLLKDPLTVVYNVRGKEGKNLEDSIKIFIKKHDTRYKKEGQKKRAIAFSNLWLQAAGTYRREGKYFKTIVSLLKAQWFDPFVVGRYILGR